MDMKLISLADWGVQTLHKQCVGRLLRGPQIHFGQPPLLFALKHRGTCNQTELARLLQVSTASIAVSLKRMEKAGVVERVPDPQDLRSNRIALTAEGLVIANRAENALFTVTRRMYEGFTPEELSSLMYFYKRMQQNLTMYRNEMNETEESI